MNLLRNNKMKSDRWQFSFPDGLLLCTIIASSFNTPVVIASSQETFNVGYTVIDLQYQSDGVSKNVTVAVWYPTIESPEQYQYGGPAFGNLAVDAEPLDNKGQFPFLAFSHGFSGCGLSSAFFTEELAARGWIVACPDHSDSHSFARIRTGSAGNTDTRGAVDAAREITLTTPAERGKYLFRPEELAAVIDGMITSPAFGSLIDVNRIAVGGHSFGGFTSLALCGTIPELRDRRIKAILMFSTGAASYLFTDEELSEVMIPSMLYLGSRERKQKRGDKTMNELSEKIFKNMPAPKYFLEIRGATHFSFNIRLSQGFGTKTLSGSRKEFETITHYSIAFLEKYVAGKPGQDAILEKKDKMLTRMVFMKTDYTKPLSGK
jgi:predicted dienelactone hydrolase